MIKLISLASKTGKITKEVASETLKSGFTIVSASNFVDSAIKITGATDPMEASKKALKIIIKRCLPPQYFVLGECVAFTAQIYAFIVSGGSWNYAAILLWLSKFIIEKQT